MNAQELTKKSNDHDNRIIELEKTMKFLEQELKKQRLIIDDLRIDIQMFSSTARKAKR